jgi:P-type E1-E2 ATPase
MDPVRLELPEGPRSFTHLALDYTGTLSLNGQLIPGVEERLRALAKGLKILVLTADTFGTVREEMAGLPVEVHLVADGGDKARILASVKPGDIVAIGNGRNDIPMLEAADLGIAVLGPEGTAAGLLESADVIVRDIRDALDLLLNPQRVKATLRD